MIASKRERIIGLLTAGVLAVLALDRLVLTPLTARGREAAAQVEAAQSDLQLAEVLFDNRPRVNERWGAMLAGGIKADVPEAESQVLNALGDWAEEAGVDLQSRRPERVETTEHFRVVVVRATCNGSLRSLTDFLWRVQTTGMPMRVTDMQITARRPGTDDLSLQLGVSTLCLPAPADPSRSPAGGGRGRAGSSSVASAAGAAGLTRGAAR